MVCLPVIFGAYLCAVLYHPKEFAIQVHTHSCSKEITLVVIANEAL